MHKLLKIDNMMYLVKDLKKSAEFYEKELGLKRVWADETYKMIGFKFAESDAEIVIHTDTTIPKYDFSFLVDNVEEFCKMFKAKGYKILKEPFDVRPGKYAVLADPDDNIIPIIDLTKFNNRPKYD